MPRQGYVYILASRLNGTLYIGVTSDLVRRIYEHREGLLPGFTRRYGVKRLVYYEMFGLVAEAITREKRLKKFLRAEKFRLIQSVNPGWRDLWDEIAAGGGM